MKIPLKWKAINAFVGQIEIPETIAKAIAILSETSPGTYLSVFKDNDFGYIAVASVLDDLKPMALTPPARSEFYQKLSEEVRVREEKLAESNEQLRLQRKSTREICSDLWIARLKSAEAVVEKYGTTNRAVAMNAFEQATYKAALDFLERTF